MTANDKRAHYRTVLHVDAWIADVLINTWSQVDLLNISVSGIAFLSDEAQITGSTRMVRFQLPDHPKPIVTPGRIVHNTAHLYLSGFRVGVEFVRLEAEDLQSIEHFIAVGGSAATQ